MISPSSPVVDIQRISILSRRTKRSTTASTLYVRGTAILLAACPDGYGNPTFSDWFRYHDLSEFEAALRTNYEINGQTAYATRDKASRYRVIMVSHLTYKQTLEMGMEKAETLDVALKMAYEHLPATPRTVVIPDGGMILPIIEKPKLDPPDRWGN